MHRDSGRECTSDGPGCGGGSSHIINAQGEEPEWSFSGAAGEGGT